MKRFILLLVICCCVAGNMYAKVPTADNKIRLTDNWEFLRQDVGNLWELVRPVQKGKPEEQEFLAKWINVVDFE